MQKGKKIKRYGNIYGRAAGSGSWLIVLAMIAGVLLFALIGWSLYTPVYSLIMGFNERNVASSQPPEAAGREPSSLAQSESEAAASSSQPATAQPAATAGIYLPFSVLSDSAALDGQLVQAKNAGINAVLVDAKDASGTVLFDTDNPTSALAGAVDPAPYDAAAVAARIAAHGMKPVARIHAFRDSLASQAVREMTVHYYDTDIVWLDNAPELGGKPWLNPYSDAARGYIVSLASELVDKGFSEIVLDSVQFPSGVGLEKAGFGPNATLPKSEQLAEFLKGLEKALSLKGATVALYLPYESVAAADSNENIALYGKNPAAIASAAAILGVSKSGQELTAALADARSAAPQTEWTVLVRAYEADGSVADVRGAVEAAQSAGAAGYLLYHPQGNYILR